MKTYKSQDTWKKIQKYLPENNRITQDSYPLEEWWEWNNNKVHIDYYPNPSSDVKLILLHGVGGNGRLLSFIGVPLYKQGYEIICPDLPGYGITQTKENNVDYSMWVNLVKDLVEYELQKDNKGIILFGLSAGGMLSYHAGCKNKNVSALIFTNLLDQRLQEVRDFSALNKYMSRIGLRVLHLLEKINRDIEIPMKMVANMKAIVNNNEFLKLLINDKISSGARVPIRFITSMINYSPDVEPENFNNCPVLLVHPEYDKWTDLRLSKLTFDKFKCKKELKILEKVGHFPLEQPGLSQLEEYIVKFIEKKI